MPSIMRSTGWMRSKITTIELSSLRVLHIRRHSCRRIFFAPAGRGTGRLAGHSSAKGKLKGSGLDGLAVIVDGHLGTMADQRKGHPCHVCRSAGPIQRGDQTIQGGSLFRQKLRIV